MSLIPVIQLNKLTKTYKRKNALVNTSFTVYQGELCGVAGLTGSGKTTLFNILCGFIRDYSGSATIAGKDVTSESTAIKRLAGFVPAEPGLPDELRAIDVIRFSAGIRGYLDEARLASLFEHFAISRKKYVKKMTLSERKRLAIACAAFFAPQVLIMDEPMLGLDNRMKERLFEFLIKEKERGTTILMTCSDYEEAERICSSVVVMHKGSVVNTSEKEKMFKLDTHRVSVLSDDDLSSVFQFFRLSPTVEPNGYISFIYTGKIDDLISAFSHYSIKDLNITYPSLGETVAGLYENQSREQENEKSSAPQYIEPAEDSGRELFSSSVKAESEAKNLSAEQENNTQSDGESNE